MSDVVSGEDGLQWWAFMSNENHQRGIAISRKLELVSQITNFSGLPEGSITCLALGPDGAVWAGGAGGGVIRFQGTNAVPTLVATNGLLANPVNAIHCDAQGAVWIATDGGIVRRDATNWTEFTQTNGAPGRLVDAIESGPDGSVWFGALDGGLARFDGRTMKPVAPGAGTFIPSAVLKIFRAADGNLWFATQTGVTRYDGTTWVPLDEGDGLLPGFINAITQDSNGGMWFGGDNGLTRYQPVVSTNPMPALMVQTDQVYTNLNALPRITAGRLVTFKFNAVDFRTRPEKRLFRYAVVPGRAAFAPPKTDVLWQPATQNAEFPWPAKARGKYTFFVQSIDRDLNYSAAAMAQLMIVPPWYANAWIMAPSGTALLGLIGWAFVARSLVVRRKREAEQLRGQMLEQERQARLKLQATNQELERAKETADAANQAKSTFHGVGAALLSISVMNLLRSQNLPGVDFPNPAEVLTALNRAFAMESQNNFYFTMWYGVADKSTRRLRYSSGGHPPAILVTGPDLVGAQVEKLKTPGPPVGTFPESVYAVQETTLQPFNRLFVFSDGAYEIVRPHGSMLTLEEFVQHLAGRVAGGKDDLPVTLSYLENARGLTTFEDDLALLEFSLM
jgi:streptogramin lyase